MGNADYSRAKPRQSFGKRAHYRMFTLGGFCVSHYWSPWGVVASGYMEAVWQDLINPAICAGLGLLLGAQLELFERMKRTS